MSAGPGCPWPNWPPLPWTRGSRGWSSPTASRLPGRRHDHERRRLRGELRDVAVSSHYLTLNGEAGTLEREAQQLSYRHSAYSDGDKFVTSAVLHLAPGDREQIRARMEELARNAGTASPWNAPAPAAPSSAGGVRRRPSSTSAASRGLRVGAPRSAKSTPALSSTPAGPPAGMCWSSPTRSERRCCARPASH